MSLSTAKSIYHLFVGVLFSAEGEAAEVAKKGDSAIGSIHDGGEGSRGEAVRAVVDAFKS